MIRTGALAAAAATAAVACVATIVSGGSPERPSTARAATPRPAVSIVDFAHLAARGRARALVRPLSSGSSISFDVRLDRGAAVELGLGRGGMLRLRRPHSRLVAGAGDAVHLTRAPGGWYRVEAGDGRGAAIDGERVRTAATGDADHLRLRVKTGTASFRALVYGPAADPATLLVQRLAWLHTRTPRRKFPLGTGLDGRLHFSRSWTSGFWSGSLWKARDLTGSPMLARWALAATLDNFGRERADTHDLGFMYERSSAAAYDHLCRGAARAAECPRLRRSALTAADSLLTLAQTNSATGTIPTRSKSVCNGCESLAEADTIIDSVMNLPLLFWAARETGDARYSDVAGRHARTVSRLMVRPDGSTVSSVHTRRSDGTVTGYHTHQGYRDDSTWARGQAWALYGFSEAAAALTDSALLDVAQRTARYVTTRDPTAVVPRYDYDAPASAPTDVSAAVISAAGMQRLASACERLGASCDPAPAEARAYAQRLLSASLSVARRRPPLGLLGHQVYGLGGRQSWDDDAELIFGLDFALEALNGTTR
jgi:unsaturated chondroitin disaccharide hydrolase